MMRDSWRARVALPSHRRQAAPKRLAGILATALLIAWLAPTSPAMADAAAVQTTWPDTVSSDPLPTVQINGVAWSQVVVNGKVYVGGEFTSARPAGSAAGTNETPRTNLLAYDLETGVLDATWAPTTDARVLSIASSPDGTRIYIAGAFTAVNGQTRYRVAALDATTGELISSFAPGVNGLVNGIKATSSTVYFTGQFSAVGSTARGAIAAVRASSGALLSNFAPTLDGGYGGRAIVISPDEGKIVVAGSFLTTNGSSSPGRGLAALDTATGALLPWAVGDVLHNAGDNAAMYSLSSDGDSVYGTGYDFGGSKTLDDFEGSFRADWSDGTMEWMEDCHGDSYSVAPLDGVVYKASHTHYCGNIGEFPQLTPWHLNHSLAFAKQPSTNTILPDLYGYRSFTGNPAGKLLHWYPLWANGSYTSAGQAGWNVEASGDYLLYAGEFVKVQGLAQQGLVRFKLKDKAANKQGPQVTGSDYVIAPRSVGADKALITWAANHDTDDASLTYQLYRRDVAAPLYQTSVDSTYWVRPSMRYLDTTVSAGNTYEYRVRVTDPHGNSTVSAWTSVTIATDGPYSAFNQAVLDSGPSAYWPLNEASGTAGYDWGGINNQTLSSSGITRGVTGPNLNALSLATHFSGTSGVSGYSTKILDGPQVFSAEAWFRTGSTRGGKILGFGSSQTGSSTNYDRHIYLSNTGSVTFGVYTSGTRTITSSPGYNNNQWHHVVATLDSSGMSLYLDDYLIGSRADTTSAQRYQGYWRVGGDTYSGWPNIGNSAYLNGDISDVAVYDRVLTRNEIDAHWVASGRASTLAPNVPPNALFTQSVADATVSLDASTSSDSDGTIASYEWDFGDGSPVASGMTASHTYSATGVYQVELTVTDDRGAQSTSTQSVSVTVPNVAPVAAFSSSSSGLDASFDATGSSDSDGTVASYAWDFGDGASGTGVKPSHTYGAAGTYSVKLTVTDDGGATGDVTHDVTVVAPASGTVVAQDAFERSVSSGWGTADTGGAWTVVSGSSSFSVAGGVGRVAVVPSATREARLSGLSLTSAVTEVEVSADAAAAGGAGSVSVLGRQVGSASYQARLRFDTNGAVRFYVVRSAGSDVVIGGSSQTLTSSYSPGDTIKVKFAVTGTSPTTVAAKAWLKSSAEPTSWQFETTDTEATLQAAGAVGLRIAVSSASTVPTTTFSVDNLAVTKLG